MQHILSFSWTWWSWAFILEDCNYYQFKIRMAIKKKATQINKAIIGKKQTKKDIQWDLSAPLNNVLFFTVIAIQFLNKSCSRLHWSASESSEWVKPDWGSRCGDPATSSIYLLSGRESKGTLYRPQCSPQSLNSQDVFCLLICEQNITDGNTRKNTCDW